MQKMQVKRKIYPFINPSRSDTTILHLTFCIFIVRQHDKSEFIFYHYTPFRVKKQHPADRLRDVYVHYLR